MNKKEQKFVDTVWKYYRAHGRDALPWRQTTDPYAVFVSEMMLQQTQVDRVVPKYTDFMERWPNAQRLASAPLSEVIRAWQGLGYNRRAKYVHETAKTVVEKHAGTFPCTYPELLALPGVGPYTAAAVLNFAYDIPTPMIETNVRRVFIHHFFSQEQEVTDAKILALVQKTLPTDSSRQWFAALMDYGTYLKNEFGNINVQSKHYTKQPAFVGSSRQIRGAIVRILSANTGLTSAAIKKNLFSFEPARIDVQLDALQEEGLVAKKKQTYILSN